MRIAVLGLGRMGHAIATRLLETGHEVTVWNRSPGKDTELVAAGARSARSIPEAVKEAEVVMTLLTADAAVEQVALGDDGVIAHLPSNAILVDMSTVSPDTSRRLGEATPGGRFIDSPILGGPEVTAKGQARFLLGGQGQTVKSLDPLWSQISSGYVYCGPNGAATTMKLLSNLNLIGGTILLAEAVVAARANGIGDEVVREVLGGSPAVAPGVRIRLEDIMTGGHEGWWTIKLAEKDAGLALQLASSHGIELPLGSAAEQVLEKTEEEGYGEKDLGAVVEAVKVSRAGAGSRG